MLLPHRRELLGVPPRGACSSATPALAPQNAGVTVMPQLPPAHPPAPGAVHSDGWRPLDDANLPPSPRCSWESGLWGAPVPVGREQDIALGLCGMRALLGLSALALSFCPCCPSSLPRPSLCQEGRSTRLSAFLTFVPLKNHNVNIVLLISFSFHCSAERLC